MAVTIWSVIAGMHVFFWVNSYADAHFMKHYINILCVIVHPVRVFVHAIRFAAHKCCHACGHKTTFRYGREACMSFCGIHPIGTWMTSVQSRHGLSIVRHSHATTPNENTSLGSPTLMRCHHISLNCMLPVILLTGRRAYHH